MGITAIIALIQLGVNTLLSVLKSSGVTKQDYSSLAASLESAIGPLFGLIGNQNAPTSVILASLGAFIGVLNTLKQQTGLPQEVVTEITEYLAAAENATAQYVKAGQGFDASQFAPVTPIQ